MYNFFHLAYRTGENTVRRDHCVGWLQHWMKMMCEVHPKPRYEDRPEWYWPTMFTIKDIHEQYVEEMKADPLLGEPFKYDQFLKILHSSFPQCRRMKEHSMFKCDVCCKLDAAMDSMKYAGKYTLQYNEAEYRRCKQQKADHMQLANDARVKYQKHQRKARQRTTLVNGELQYKYLCLIIDGITSTTTVVPGYQRRRDLAQKFGETSAPCHLTGCKDATGRVYAAWNWDNVPKDGNFVPNVLLRVLDIYKEEHGYLPPVLYMQLDNTCRENKNKFVFSFLAYLVTMGVFKKIKVNFLLVGHTHEDIDQYFSVVSKGLVRNHPRTLPHMQRTVELLREDTVQFLLKDYIDFKSWLHGHSDLSLGNLAPDHQFRFAMVPKPLPAGWRSTGRAVMQSKVHAEIQAGYLPVVGTTPLLSLPAGDDWPMLGEKRPLFCNKQPYARAADLAGNAEVDACDDDLDGTSSEAGGGGRVPLPCHRMNCGQFLKSLDKLEGIIKKLVDEHYFWDSRQDFTMEQMLGWWNCFLAEQRQIMVVPALRKARALTEENCGELFRAFTRICLGSSLRNAEVECTASMSHDLVATGVASTDMHVTAHVPTGEAVMPAESDAASTRSAEAEAGPYISPCSYGRILETWRGPTSNHLEMLDMEDLSGLAEKLAEVPPTKPHVVLSCGGVRDSCSSWMGEGSIPKTGETRGKQQWVWVGEVQSVVEHSEDWKNATLDVHWYWQPVKGPGRQWLPCFRTPNMPADQWIRDREGLPANLQCQIENPEYWFTSKVDIHLSSVLATFNHWEEVHPGKKVAAGEGEKKLYLPTHVRNHCMKRCKDMQAEADGHDPQSVEAGPTASTQGAADIVMREAEHGGAIVASTLEPPTIDRGGAAGGQGSGEDMVRLIVPSFPQEAAAARRQEKLRANKRKKTAGILDEAEQLARGKQAKGAQVP